MIPLNLAELTTVSRAQNNILKNDTHVGAAFSQPGSRRPSDYKKIPPNAEALSDLEESPSPASGCRSIQTRLDGLCVSTRSLSPWLLAIFGKTTFYAFTRTARRSQTKPLYNGTFYKRKQNSLRSSQHMEICYTH